MKFLLALIVASSIAACSLFDSGVEWRGGPYALLWIDTPENISLVRQIDDDSSIGRVDATVFAVGWDGRYAVAMQHPGGDRRITNYFIIDSQRDSPYADTEQVVIGPLTQEAFHKKSEELNLPEFSKKLPSLE